MLTALRTHWQEYLIEAWCLGTFMVSACVFGILLFHPGSPTAGLSFELRTVLIGIAMGSTAISIICSPWGKRSGAHFNPAVTLTFLRLGKIARSDALFYILFQFAGGLLGVLATFLIFGSLLSDSAVNFVATVPGKWGVGVAFAAEVIISFFMMTMILFTSNSARWSRLTPFLAGLFVATYISLESPVSGMSMNPARSFASAAFSGTWIGWWIYFLAPPIAMLAAAEVFVRVRGLSSVLCAKLHHHNRARCIFNCRFGELRTGTIEVTNNTHLFPTIAGLF
jgi:aquaporin Z